MMETRWSVEQVRALGVTTDLITAAAVLGFGRSSAYAMVRDGRFPVPFRKAGARYLVNVADLLRAVGVELLPVPAALIPDPAAAWIAVDHDPQIPPTDSPRVTRRDEQDRP